MDKDIFKQVIVVDTETTGVDVTECEVLQMAEGRYVDGDWVINEMLYDVEGEVTALISSINNLTKDMVAGKPFFKDAVENDLGKLVDEHEGPCYLLAHNAVFDSYVVQNNGFSRDVKWLCTRRITKKIFHDDLG